MDEKTFEDVICKYPEVIEKDLLFKGRQVKVRGKRVDVLFEDRHGQDLIVEIKKGTVQRVAVGQLFEYEADPSIPFNTQSWQIALDLYKFLQPMIKVIGQLVREYYEQGAFVVPIKFPK